MSPTPAKLSDDYSDPPYRRTVWILHRYRGRLILEERVLASDPATGEFSELVRHDYMPIHEIEDPPPAKFESIGESLAEGESIELDPASDYWDDEEDLEDDADEEEEDEQDTEIALSRRAGELVAERVIPHLEKAIRAAARELASEGIEFKPDLEWRGAARIVIEALARYLLQDITLLGYELAQFETLNPEIVRQWFEDNLLE